MSKRSEEAALRLYPESSGPMERSIFEDRRVTLACRRACERGYEQAEKDTIERVIDWVRKNAYIYTDIQNDEEGNLMTVFLEKAFIDDLTKAMEEEL